MEKNIFETLGKELDSLFENGIEVLKEVEDTLTKALDEENLQSKFNKFSEFMESMAKDLEENVSEIKKETNISKKKIFNLKINDIEDIVIKYNKKQNIIEVKKEGVDKSFKIALKEGISKKKVKKILTNVVYDKEISIVTITVKRKYLKKD